MRKTFTIESGEVNLGVSKEDLIALQEIFPLEGLKVLASQSPARRVFIQRFRVDAFQVTIDEFFKYLDGSNDFDRAYWSTVREALSDVGRNRPILGVSQQEAEQFAAAYGGRLLTKDEFEYLLRGDSLSGFLGKNPRRVSSEYSPGYFPDLVRALQPVFDAHESPAFKGVRGLYGNASELVANDQVSGCDETSQGEVCVSANGVAHPWFHASYFEYRRQAFRSDNRPFTRPLSLDSPGFRCAYNE